jgi:PII-like signaling protein
MSLIGEQVLLRAYARGGDRPPLMPTHQRIVEAARRNKLAGATVLKGILGFGHHGLARDSAWALIDHSPVIVEIVDSAGKMAAFIQGPLRTIMSGGFFTLERAAVMIYRHRANDQPGNLSLAAALPPLSTMPAFHSGDQMTTNSNGVLLRVFIGDSDRFEHQPLYEAVLQKARQLGLAGATVLRGTEGFGAHSVVHKTSLLEMSADLPLVIEIVDEDEKIKLLLPHLDAMVREGMVTMEHVLICSYRA